MTSEERVLKTLKREPVDRIPSFEWLTDKKVVEALCPGLSEEEFIYAMDLDAVCVELNYKTELVKADVYKDEWGQVKQYTAEAHPLPLYGPITDADDLKRYTPPNPHDGARYRSLESALERNKGKKAVILHLNDVLSVPSRLMTYEDFMCAMALEPEFISDLINMTVDIQLEMAAEAVKRGLKICYTGDDFAYTTGPLMSPQVFEELFYPPMKRVIGGYKELGLMVIKHTDGNILPIMDMILDSGIDCIDPIDPLAGMDLGYFKTHFGDRVAIKGNVDCAQLLSFGTVEETIEASKECIKVGGVGNGYIFSSSNSIHSSVKPENYKAMLDTLKKYGSYPIAL